MGTVTIAATYGAGGSVVARAVAEGMGLPLIDRAIPADLALEMQPQGSELAPDEQAEGGALARVMQHAVSLSGLYVGVPELRDVDERVTATEAVLRRAAESSGAVILGRAGVFVLKGHHDTLHVRLDGPPEARVRQAMEHEHLDREAAERMLRANDRARNAYVRHFHPGEHWDDPRNYHLVIDSTAVPLPACSSLILIAAKARFAALEGAAGQS